jgi:hypothetical protein
MPEYQISRLSKRNSDMTKMRSIVFNEARFDCDSQEIVDKLPWFVSVVKGHIADEKMNDCINLAPILKKFTFRTDKSRISEYMHWHMEENGLSRNKEETKLTQLLSTHRQFMSFGMYELWFLIDE